MATSLIGLLWPLSVCSKLPVCMDHTFSRKSSPPVTTRPAVFGESKSQQQHQIEIKECQVREQGDNTPARMACMHARKTKNAGTDGIHPRKLVALERPTTHHIA